jgi:hypothetical protein
MSDVRSSIKNGIEEFASLTKQLFDSLVTIGEGRVQFRTETFREPDVIMKEIIAVDQKLQEDVAKRINIQSFNSSKHTLIEFKIQISLIFEVREEQLFFNMVLAIGARVKEKEEEILTLQTYLKRVDERLR